MLSPLNNASNESNRNEERVDTVHPLAHHLILPMRLWIWSNSAASAPVVRKVPPPLVLFDINQNLVFLAALQSQVLFPFDTARKHRQITSVSANL